MKRAQIHGPDDVRLDDVPTPKPGPRDAVVRVDACGICGSDLGYVKLGGLAGPTREPMPLGHELAGVIEALGTEEEGPAVGTRVVVHPTAGGNMIGNGGREGAFAPLLLVRNAADGGRLFAIPDGLPSDIAALAEPLGVGMNAVDQSEAAAGEKVVVFGAGPIGLAATAVLADRGVDDVIVVDFSDTRLQIASALGARETLHPERDDVWGRIRELHGTSPVMGAPMAASDAYIECTGVAGVIGQILGNAKAKARLSVVALHRQEVPVSFLLVMMKELTIRGAMEYPDRFEAMLELLERRDLSAMISHHFPLERFDEAFATARDPNACGKVIVEIAQP
jgi:threonine dehydrogenase-like Zn-dependent dehydrogenase